MMIAALRVWGGRLDLGRDHGRAVPHVIVPNPAPVSPEFDWITARWPWAGLRTAVLWRSLEGARNCRASAGRKGRRSMRPRTTGELEPPRCQSRARVKA